MDIGAPIGRSPATQDQRLANFALALLKHLQTTDWWTDEHWWEVSEIGLEHRIFEDEPTGYDTHDYPDRYITSWVQDRLSDDCLTPYIHHEATHQQADEPLPTYLTCRQCGVTVASVDQPVPTECLSCEDHKN